MEVELKINSLQKQCDERIRLQCQKQQVEFEIKLLEERNANNARIDRKFEQLQLSKEQHEKAVTQFAEQRNSLNNSKKVLKKYEKTTVKKIKNQMTKYHETSEELSAVCNALSHIVSQHEGMLVCQNCYYTSCDTN